MSTQQRSQQSGTNSAKKTNGPHRRTSPVAGIGRLLGLAALLALLLPQIGPLSPSSTAIRARAQDTHRHAANNEPANSPQVSFRNTDPRVAYVGSKACESCHEAEYRKFLQTPHGVSATMAAGRAELTKLPSEGVTICQSDGTTCFRVFPGKGGYYMSQFERSSEGSEAHAEVEKIAFALGQPLIATGYVVQRGEYLFEAPLTFYKEPGDGHIQGWGLSPGYGNDSVGFTRPLVDSCLTCHLGRPRATDAASNRYQSPPFAELSIGCENCHGPGALHVRERRAGLPLQRIDNSIVNPRHLTAQLADETCMYCHELGQARVPLPGRSFQDYRPGVPLLQTQAIFKSKLLLGWNLEEWQDEMATSACYRFSKGGLRCSTCHDPHVTPGAQEAPALYRAKCLTCHQSSSCTLPLAARQQTQPVDNCITCHMPKHVAPKLVKAGGRGTSHRITRTDDEAVPAMDTPQTVTDPDTGMVLVNSDAADAQRRLPPVVLLSAYMGVLNRDRSRMDIAEHYQALLQQMTNDQSSALVPSALAGVELAKHTPDADQQAMHDLQKAVDLDSRFPNDYLLLSTLQVRGGDFAAAARVLLLAIEKFPYLPAPYERLAACYLGAGEQAKASGILRRGLELFPADKHLLQLAQKSQQP
jgi:hypothetical protein